jgi:hypothetical protein
MKTKTILTLLLIAVAISAQAQQKKVVEQPPAITFTIEGKIKGLIPGDTLTFERITMPGFNRSFAFDVIVEKQDKFTYNDTHEHTEYYIMTYKPIRKETVHSDRAGLTMLIQDGTTRLSGTASQIYYCKLEGGLYDNESLQKALQLENSLGKERAAFSQLIEEANVAKDTVKTKEYYDKFNSFHFDNKEDFQKLSILKNEFYDKFPSSEHTIIDALQRVNSAPFEKIKTAYEKMNLKARESYFGKILEKEIDKITALQSGKKAPDFRLIGLNGKEISLKDCAGSFVLIYHWGLCPGSLMIDKEVIDLHNKYKEHLIIIGITDKIDYIKSIYENISPNSTLMNIELKPVLKNMLAHPWFDAEKTNGNEIIEDDYAFGGLPFFVFISPDGKIIARDFHKAFYAAKEKMEAEFSNREIIND